MSDVRPVSDPAAARLEPPVGAGWPLQPKPAGVHRLERLVPGSGVRLRPRKVVDERSRYPTSDGKPLAESEKHFEAIVAVWHALRGVAERQPRTFVGSNQLVYYEEGNPKKCFAPDCYLMVNTDLTEPPNILTWVDGIPTCIIEVTSKKTRRKDLYDKRVLYQALGVREYVLFDPLDDYLKPALQVFRLENGAYVRQEGDAEGRFGLKVLPVELYREGRWLRVRDVETGEHVPRPDDDRRLRQAAEQEREEARAKARRERTRADREKRNAEQERMKAEQERMKAEQAENRAEQAENRAEQERQRAEKVEAQLQALQQLMARLGLSGP